MCAGNRTGGSNPLASAKNENAEDLSSGFLFYRGWHSLPLASTKLYILKELIYYSVHSRSVYLYLRDILTKGDDAFAHGIHECIFGIGTADRSGDQ